MKATIYSATGALAWAKWSGERLGGNRIIVARQPRGAHHTAPLAARLLSCRSVHPSFDG
jgi:fermentation-respiration switch protein FrsA (DUF1100 family)